MVVESCCRKRPCDIYSKSMDEMTLYNNFDTGDFLVDVLAVAHAVTVWCRRCRPRFTGNLVRADMHCSARFDRYCAAIWLLQ